MKKKAIAILTTILISIPIFMDTPFAEAHGPNNIIETPYGTCTYEFYYDNANTHDVTIGGVTIPGTGPIHLIRYTFTHPYTGTFDVDLNMSSILNNIWNLITTNCYLISVPEADTLRFGVNNATYCEIAITPSQYYNKLFINLKNQNLTAVEDVTTAVNTIMTTTNYMSGQIQTMSANTTAIRNVLLESLGGYTSANENVHTDFTNLLTAFNTVGTDISDILTAVNSIDTNLATLTSTETQSYTLLDNIKSYLLNAIGDYSSNTSIHSDLVNIVNAVNQYGTNITALVNAINSINSQLSILDNNLDTISWKSLFSGNGATYSLSNTLSNPNNLTYYSYNDQALNSNSKFLYIKLPSVGVGDLNLLSCLFRIKFSARSYTMNPSNYINVHYYYNNFNSDNNLGYYSIAFPSSYIYLDGMYYLSVPSYIILEQSVNNRWYITNDLIDIHYLDSYDIEYWKLLTYFSAYNYQTETKTLLQQIIDAIKGINVTQNTTETNINQSINNYDTNINPVYNVENNFSTQFNNYNQQFNPDFTDTMSNINNVPSVMNNVIVDLYNLPFIKYPVLLTLAGIVLIALLGV